MQWDSSANAGFCPPGVEPWLPIAADADRVNVETQRYDPGSMLSLTARLLSLRRSSPALQSGRYCPRESPEGTFVYEREGNGERWLVALNLTADTHAVSLSDVTPESIISTHLDRDTVESLDPLNLRPNEGVLVRLATP
jgi:alpha-glucosidase